MVRAMCGVQLKDRKRSTNLMLMLGLSVAIDQLAMATLIYGYTQAKAKNVRWDGHMLRREDGSVLRRALNFEVEGQK